MPLPFKVKAIYDYSSPHDDDLNFTNGQIINVTDEEDQDWYTGQYIDAAGANQEGLFPRNFVERYEPEIPSRPARPGKQKKEADTAIVETLETARAIPAPASADGLEEEKLEESVRPTAAKAMSPATPSIPQTAEVHQPSPSVEKSEPIQPAADLAQKPTATKAPPPQVAAKPASGSFKDRIAAFNKPTAPPITPYKPNSQSGGSSGFIKKPFVAPPPSKNAYVPPPREPPPQKVYRREEDSAAPETESQGRYQESNEHAPEGEQSKPTSLKDRIALLQKQQLEQAARQSEAVQKKDKPKRPPKKRFDSQEQASQIEETVGAKSLPTDVTEPTGKRSVDFTEEEASSIPKHPERHPIPSSSMATPPQPSRELMSDTNDADYSAADDTEDAEEISNSREDTHSEIQNRVRLPSSSARPAPSTSERLPLESAKTNVEAAESEGTDEDEGEDEEGDVDPEVKRRMEIRERMAKMSGGMGMMGMFGPPGGIPASGGTKKSKVSGERQRTTTGGPDDFSQMAQAPPIPIMALPGMSKPKGSDPTTAEAEPEADSNNEQTPTNLLSKQRAVEAVPDIEEVVPEQLGRSPPVRPQDRVPPPPPRETRPPPSAAPEGLPFQPSSPPTSRGAPEIPKAAAPLSTGEDSDDELSHGASRLSLEQTIAGGRAKPVQASPSIPSVPSRTSTDLQSHDLAPSGQTIHTQKRVSRPPPPVPASSTPDTSPTQARAPPPPPPGHPPSRKSTSDSRIAPSLSKHQVNNDSEEEVTEYDGDYDTDIASGAKHKDALKAHDGDSSYDEGTITDEATNKSPTSPPARGPPPLPPIAAPRAVPPPPPPGQPPKPSRKSSDMPRAAPPPIPPSREQTNEEDYDPFRYTRGVPPPPPPNTRPPIVKSPSQELDEDDMYGGSPISSPQALPPPSPSERNLPPHPPAPTHAPQHPLGMANVPRQSLDVSRSKSMGRRSMEQPRPSADTGFIASDVDLAERSFWWTQENLPPPALQKSKDVLFEMETSPSSSQAGKPTISKDVYIIYMDYSQTTITATFDPSNPSDVSLEQKHQRPPPPLRQDQLENASLKYGARISEAVTAAQNTVVGDGTPSSLVLELLRPLSSEALMPVGLRTYGALVYANLANASTQQFDEIRAGDIVTFRNAKFQGHRGTMHQKYTAEAGKPDHVGVVLDWDGTKKKIRAWEQGRESKKVKVESFKLGDLRSGECRVWRVMGRDWVGWDAK